MNLNESRTLGGRLKALPVLLRFVALVLGGVADADSLPAQEADAAALTVRTASIQRALRPQLLQASGPISAWEEARIDAQVGGLALIEAPAQVGDRVHKGQLLGRFDDTSVRIEIAAAQAAVDQAQTMATEAGIDRDRAVRLEGTGALSAQDILRAKTRAASADAQLQGARASLAAAQLKWVHTRVIAPDDGVISSRTVALGGVATPGTELFKLIRQERLQWRAELTGPQLAQVRLGMPVDVELPDGTRVSGRTRTLSPSLDATTQLGVLYADLLPSPALRAGLYVKGEVELGLHPVMLVPSESIVTREGRTYAVTLQANRAHLVPVSTTGVRGTTDTELLTELPSNTALITQGAGFLSEGMLVHVAPTIKSISAP